MKKQRFQMKFLFNWHFNNAGTVSEKITIIEAKESFSSPMFSITKQPPWKRL